MTFDEIKALSVEGIEERVSMIREEMNAENADIDALTAEVEALEVRRNELKAEVEKRNALATRIAGGEGAPVAIFEKQEENTMEVRFDKNSQEYRTAWLKTIAVRNGEKLLGNLTEVEERAYTHTTANTGAVVPTDIANRIIELVRSEAPMLADATMSALTRGFAVPRHSAIVAGDATSVAEGVANDDEQDTFELLPLDGVEIKKHVVITRKMQFQSIDAFEEWLIQHLAKRIRVAKERVILARLDGTAPAGGTAVSEAAIASANVLTGQAYTDEAIRAMFALLEAPGEKVVYANNATIWNHLAGIVDGEGHKLFVPSGMADPVVAGRIYGATIKEDCNLADNTIYVVAKGQILANDFDELAIFAAVEPKTANTIETAYALFDAGIENPKGAVKATFTVA